MTQMKSELLYSDVDLNKMTFEEMRAFMEKAQQDACQWSSAPQNFRFVQFFEYDNWGGGYTDVLRVFFDRPETDKERKERELKEEKEKARKEKKRAAAKLGRERAKEKKEAAEREEYERLKAKFEGEV